MELSHYLLLAAALFSLGLFGVASRPSAVGLLASIELMANAVNLNFVAFSRFRPMERVRCSRLLDGDHGRRGRRGLAP